jgi:transaldolase/glucose-6-phosphate isomerase
MKRWTANDLVNDLWARRSSIWGSAASSAVEWLGWLDLPRAMLPKLDEITRTAEEVVSEGLDDVVLMGMGGSSLAPEMLFSVFGQAPGYPRLWVIDSTHPEAVASLDNRIDPSRTFFLVSSKSGTTVETLSFYRYFWERCPDAGQRFAAITDQGTPLDKLAREKGFRAVFNAPSDVGGRFSAFSVFGLVPAALTGVDLSALLSSAQQMAVEGRLGPEENSALQLGLSLGAAAGAGMDKLTLHTSSSLAAFPAWMEQLVAESLGKNGRGIIPVAGEPVLPSGQYRSDRVLALWEVAGDEPVGLSDVDVRIALEDRIDLGADLFRAELAVAVAGEVLGVNPFDQPDVEEAKRLASQAMGSPGKVTGTDLIPAQSPQARGIVRKIVEDLGPSDYLGIQAYLPPHPELDRRIAGIRHRITELSGVATTFGYGPRFLHSTGQVHKGGPPGGVFLQIVDDPRQEVTVPGAGYGFSKLISAQAEGDYFALQGAGRRVIRLDVGTDRLGGLQALENSLF